MAKRAVKKATKKASKRPVKAAKAKAKVAKRTKPAKVVAKPAAKPAAPRWKPQGMQSGLVNLSVPDCAKALAWWAEVFGAKELGQRALAPDGKSIWHAEFRIDDTVFYANDVMPGQAASRTSIYLYVPNVDEVHARAVAHGASIVMPLDDMFWGDRSGMVTDPFGVNWAITTRKEVLSAEEMDRRGREFAAKMAQQSAVAMAPRPSSPPAMA